MLNALDEYLEPVEIVVIRGRRRPNSQAWQAALAREYAPRRLVLAIPSDAAGLPEALATEAPAGSHGRLRLPRSRMLGADRVASTALSAARP